jgi:hypothetical protein
VEPGPVPGAVGIGPEDEVLVGPPPPPLLVEVGPGVLEVDVPAPGRHWL